VHLALDPLRGDGMLGEDDDEDRSRVQLAQDHVLQATRPQVVLVIPDIGACVAQGRHDLAAEGVVLVAVADEDAQVCRGCHKTPLLLVYTLMSWLIGNAGCWFILARAGRRGRRPLPLTPSPRRGGGTRGDPLLAGGANARQRLGKPCGDVVIGEAEDEQTTVGKDVVAS